MTVIQTIKGDNEMLIPVKVITAEGNKAIIRIHRTLTLVPVSSLVFQNGRAFYRLACSVPAAA